MARADHIDRRDFLKGTGSAAAVTALGTLPGAGAGQTGTEAAGNDLRLINATMTTLDPVEATDTASGTVIQQMFDSLTNYVNGEATVENLLAADYQVSDDFLTYEFQLKDAQFHNGDDVTASDIVYSFERLAASENSNRDYFILDSLGVTHETDDEGNYVPGSLGVEAVDESTLAVNLSEPFHSVLEMLAYTAFAALPEGIIGDIEGYDGEMSHQEFATSNPIGAGPFQFDAWQSGTEARVEAFDNYHGEGPNVGGVHWQVIEDDSAAYNYGMNKNADVISIPTAQYDPSKVSVEQTDDIGREIGTYGPLRNGETANYMSVPEISIFYIGFNMSSVEKPVRQAFAHVTNQETLVQQVFKQRGVPAYHFTPPSIFPGGADQYSSRAESEYPYGYNQTQVSEARSVMEEAGYSQSNPYEVEFTIYESDVWSEVSQLLRDQLANAHINVSINQAPFSTLLTRGRNGELEAYSLGWIADWPAPDNFLQLLNPPQTDTSLDAPISYLNWSSESGDAAQQAEQAYQTVLNNPAPTDEATQAREDAYLQIEDANWEDVAMLPIYHSLGERFWYDWVEIPPHGGMGPSRQKYNTVTLGERQ